MDTEIIAAILGGIFAILASLIPLYIIRSRERKNAEKNIPATEGLSAAIGIVQRGNEVIMVQRRTRYRRLSWQFPAGVIKPGMDPRDRVECEIASETGVHCQVKRYLGARVHEETKVLCHYFHCTYLDGELKNLDPEENSQVAWVKAGEVHNYVTSSIFLEVENLLDAIKGTTGVRVVLGVVPDEGKILLVEKRGSGDENLWQLPGGTIEGKETEKEALIREVKEETGVICTPKKKLGERIHPISHQQICYWLCDYKSGIATVKEPDKFIEVQWIAAAEAINLLGDSLYAPVKAILENMRKD